MTDCVGSRVKSAIQSAGLTQKQVAEAIGVTQQSVTKWIKTNNISRDNLNELSKITGYTFSWLSNGRGLQRHYHASCIYSLIAESGLTHTKIIEELDIAPKTLVQWVGESNGDKISEIVDQLVDVANFDCDTLRRAIQHVCTEEGMPHAQEVELAGDYAAGFIPVCGILHVDENEQWLPFEESNHKHVNVPMTDPTSYGIIIKGHAFDPALLNGWLLVIEPNTPPEPGEYALIRNTQQQYMICELLYQKGDEISVCSLPDDKKRATLALEDIEFIHQIGMILPPSKLIKDDA